MIVIRVDLDDCFGADQRWRCFLPNDRLGTSIVEKARRTRRVSRHEGTQGDGDGLPAAPRSTEIQRRTTYDDWRLARTERLTVRRRTDGDAWGRVARGTRLGEERMSAPPDNGYTDRPQQGLPSVSCQVERQQAHGDLHQLDLEH
ncbi:unnamed protein product [Closterium sp. Yama58-4]|nr:unnamed protein product [Closterium sp. Yama58-4]